MIDLDLAHKKLFCMPRTKEVRWLNPKSVGWESVLFPQKVTAGSLQLAKIFNPLKGRENK